MGDEPTYPTGFASLATVERHHIDNNAKWAKHEERHERMEGRMGAVERSQAETEYRLRAGAETFGQLTKDLELAKGNTLGKYKFWFGLLIALLVPTIGMIIFLAQIPTPEKFDRVIDQVNTIDKSVIQMREVLGSVKATVDDMRRASRRDVPASIGPFTP